MRQDEIPELEQLKEHCEFDVKGGTENEYGKVNILLQSYISKSFVESFSLVSDMSYVAQVRKYLQILRLIIDALLIIVVRPSTLSSHLGTIPKRPFSTIYEGYISFSCCVYLV